jgi:hypothetical protein
VVRIDPSSDSKATTVVSGTRRHCGRRCRPARLPAGSQRVPLGYSKLQVLFVGVLAASTIQFVPGA